MIKMTSLEFCKFHGFGNDYIVVEESRLGPDPDLGALSVSMCHRHTGVGGDGIALVSESGDGESDFSCRIFNPDGSEAGFSGNGTRCAVAYLYFKDLWSDRELRLDTPSGKKHFSVKDVKGHSYQFLSTLGRPSFRASEIPFRSDRTSPDDVIEDFSMRVGVRELNVTCLNVGNPVCVVFVDGFDFNWRRAGSLLESDGHFPERTNVVFVRIVSESKIEIRIWERGAGETSSSGTCSIAAAVASANSGRTGRELDVVAPGGTTKAFWREDGEMLIDGIAELAFCGSYEFSDKD